MEQWAVLWEVVVGQTPNSKREAEKRQPEEGMSSKAAWVELAQEGRPKPPAWSARPAAAVKTGARVWP